MYGMTDDGIRQLAEGVKTLRQRVFRAIGDTKFQVTFSISAASIPEDGIGAGFVQSC